MEECGDPAFVQEIVTSSSWGVVYVVCKHEPPQWTNGWTKPIISPLFSAVELAEELTLCLHPPELGFLRGRENSWDIIDDLEGHWGFALAGYFVDFFGISDGDFTFGTEETVKQLVEYFELWRVAAGSPIYPADEAEIAAVNKLAATPSSSRAELAKWPAPLLWLLEGEIEHSHYGGGHGYAFGECSDYDPLRPMVLEKARVTAADASDCMIIGPLRTTDSFLASRPSGTTVTAKKDSKVAVLPYKNYEAAVRNHPDVSKLLMSYLGQKRCLMEHWRLPGPWITCGGSVLRGTAGPARGGWARTIT